MTLAPGRRWARGGWGPRQPGAHLPESVFTSAASAKDLPSAPKIKGPFQAGLQTHRLRLLVWTGEKKSESCGEAEKGRTRPSQPGTAGRGEGHVWLGQKPLSPSLGEAAPKVRGGLPSPARSWQRLGCETGRLWGARLSLVTFARGVTRLGALILSFEALPPLHPNPGVTGGHGVPLSPSEGPRVLDSWTQVPRTPTSGSQPIVRLVEWEAQGPST